MPLRPPSARPPRPLLLALATVLGLVGCGGSASPDALGVLSMGDSLAVGVQPKLLGGTRDTSQGYPRQLAGMLRDEGREVELTELGCGGATSQSVLVGIRPCAPSRDTPYRNQDPSTSQAAYAEGRLSTTKGRRRVVLLDIGGNDVGSCFSQGRVLPGCIARAGEGLRQNLGVLLGRLRAVDRTVPIAVLTLYDPLLGLWDDHPEARPLLAREHRTFQRSVNGAIVRAARRHGVLVADLAGAMAQDDPLRADAPGRPAAVAAVCRYTWMCVDAPRVPDIHLREDGYRLAAEAALTALRPRLGAPR